MSFEPETAVCPKCKRHGCFTQDEEPAHEQGIEYPDVVFRDWTCKCGHTITEEFHAATRNQPSFTGGLGKP